MKKSFGAIQCTVFRSSWIASNLPPHKIAITIAQAISAATRWGVRGRPVADPIIKPEQYGARSRAFPESLLLPNHYEPRFRCAKCFRRQGIAWHPQIAQMN